MFQAVEVILTATPRLSPELERLIRAVDELVDNPAVLRRMMRQAVAETLLQAYRERFLNRLTEAITMRVATKNLESTKGLALDQAKDALASAADDLTSAQIDGRPTGSLEKKLAKAEKRLTDAVGHDESSPLSTGKFRVLALQVLRVMSEMAVQSVGTDLQLGVGHLGTLNAIATPSATPLVTGHDTESQYKTLWKHLEFGTGIFASNAQLNAGSEFRADSGGWWFGPRKGLGLHLLGSPGLHALFDPGTGLPYTQDALRFESVFEEYFKRALLGRAA